MSLSPKTRGAGRTRNQPALLSVPIHCPQLTPPVAAFLRFSALHRAQSEHVRCWLPAERSVLRPTRFAFICLLVQSPSQEPGGKEEKKTLSLQPPGCLGGLGLPEPSPWAHRGASGVAGTFVFRPGYTCASVRPLSRPPRAPPGPLSHKRFP